MMTPAPHRHPLLSHRASDEEVIALTVPYRSKATPVSKQPEDDDRFENSTYYVFVSYAFSWKALWQHYYMLRYMHTPLFPICQYSGFDKEHIPLEYS